MSIFENITKALDVPFKQFGIDNNIKTCLENIDAPKSTNTPFLSSFMLNAPVEQADLDHSEFRQGIYQIDIHYASAEGSAPVNKMADLLNKTFYTGSSFSRDTICLQVQSVSLEPLTVDNGWATRSMSIVWQTFTPRI